MQIALRKKTVKGIVLLIASTLLTACGTFNTLNKTDKEISSHLTKQKTTCKSITRVYSGLAYDFCYLNANPGGGTYFLNLLPLYLVDGAVSATADTLLLPYTGYLQYKQGSIDITK